MFKIQQHGWEMRKTIFILTLLVCIFMLCSFQAKAEPLLVEQAFKFSMKAVNSNKLEAVWDIAKGFHLYKFSLEISVANKNGTKLGKIVYPKGIPKEDNIYGKHQVYDELLVVNVPVVKWGRGETEFVVKYQGCEGSLRCYPPNTEVVLIEAPGDNGHSNLISQTDLVEELNYFSFLTPSLSSTKTMLEGGNILLILGSFFIFGIFLSLTPCVLPMIPILLGLIMGQRDAKKIQAFFLSLSYVFGMAITYAIAGMITAVLGNSVQSILQNVWVISACSLLFVLLSLSLFGLYEIQLPSFLLSRLSNTANKTKSGSYVGVFFMGVISSLIVSPCVSAPLAGTLIYIASTGNVLLGGSALFVLALGMGILLVVAGTSGGKLLLKSGGWMLSVRYLLGIVMIAFAIWMLGRVIPSDWTNMLYGMLLIGTAIYMGAIDPVEQSRWKRFVKMIAFFILVLGIGIVFRFSNTNMTLSRTNTAQVSALPTGSQVTADNEETHENSVFTRVTTIEQMDKLIDKANEEHKPVMIDYYADWCATCKKMEETTFKNANIKSTLQSFVAIQADITKNNADSTAMKKKYGIFAPPHIVFLAPDGKEVSELSIAGDVNANDLNQKLKMILSVYTSQ